MAMALAMTTANPSASLGGIATAPSLTKTIATSLLIAPTSSVSLTPRPPGDPVVSPDAPADDPSSLSTSGGNHTLGNANVGSNTTGAPSAGTSGPSAGRGQTAAASAHLPSGEPEQGQCLASAGSSSITHACCASVKGSLDQNGAYCVFPHEGSKTWESCVATATDDDSGAAFAIRCNGAGRSKATWAVIGLGIAVALGFS